MIGRDDLYSAAYTEDFDTPFVLDVDIGATAALPMLRVKGVSHNLDTLRLNRWFLATSTAEDGGSISIFWARFKCFYCSYPAT
jgi:hypothetical protein